MNFDTAIDKIGLLEPYDDGALTKVKGILSKVKHNDERMAATDYARTRGFEV